MLDDPSKPKVFGEWDKSVAQMRQRQASLLWWLKLREKYPMGLVPIATAARMIGVSRTRMWNILRDQGWPLIDDMPGGTAFDRLVPIECLIVAPFRANRGQPGNWGGRAKKSKKMKNNFPVRGGYKVRLSAASKPLSDNDLNATQPV